MDRNIKKLQEPVNGVQYITSPSLREELKPIVFFDSGGSLMEREELLIDFHPHSGVGIITYIPRSELHHRDTGGGGGVLPEGGAQWMLTGSGLWHRESYRPASGGDGKPWPLFIHQLWVQLPPEAEESDVEYTALRPEDMPVADGVRVLVGEYGGVRGGIRVPLNMTYLDVHMDEGETREITTPPGQTRGVIQPRGNTVTAGDIEVGENTLGILEENEGVLRLHAKASADFVLIMAEPSPHEIIASRGSMHTNMESLRRSRRRIEELGQSLEFARTGFAHPQGAKK